ncbi:hypothetical protein NAI52_12255, partial [Francisella tularensis subsp. holarctica]|nr:hypothetical protein [Francisella tularensis subsp. holarctica]
INFSYDAAQEGVGIQWGIFFPQAYLTGGIMMSRYALSGSPAQIAEIPTKYDVANIGGKVRRNLLRGGYDDAQKKKKSN